MKFKAELVFITMFIMAAYTGLLIHAMTSNAFIIVRIMEPFWFLLAVIMAFPKLEASSKKVGDI